MQHDEIKDLSKISVGYKTMSDLVCDAYNEMEKRYQSPVKITGIRSGFKALDQITEGLHKGKLVVIGGRVAMGKTMLAQNIAVNASTSKKKHSVVLLSMNIGNLQAVIRMMAGIASVAVRQIYRGTLKAKDWRALAAASSLLANTNLIMRDHFKTLFELQRSCEQVNNDGLDLIVVDDLQALHKQLSIHQGAPSISAIIWTLKNIAKELDVAIIVTSNLKPSLELRDDKRPMISDLYQAEVIEQAADVIMLLYREEAYRTLPVHQGLAEIFIAKQHEGELTTIKLKFEGKYCQFRNLKLSLDDDHKWVSDSKALS